MIERRGGRRGAVILTSWAHMADDPVRSSQFPTGTLTLGLDYMSDWIFLLGSCHWPDTIILFLFSHWYNGSHKMEIIAEWYYAKELIFLSTQKLYHMTEKYWTSWMPHAFIMFFKGKNYYSNFNHKHSIIKLAMWMYNFCQKKKKNQGNMPRLSFVLISFRTSDWHPIF